MWNQYLMIGFVPAHISLNTISNLELRRSYQALRDDLVLLSTTTLSNICRREHALTMDAIKKQLLSRNIVSLALDGLTSTNTLATMSVIAYKMDWNWALRDVQLAFNEVDRLFLSTIESYLWMIGHGTTYWSKASRIFEGHAWLFWAYQWPIGWYYNW